GQQYGACALDMESAVVAEYCAARGVPWYAVRAVSDDADTGLSPRLAELLAGDRVSWWRFALAVVRSPRLIGECLRLSKATRLAAERLGVALHQLIGGGELRDGSMARARPPEPAGHQIGDADEGNRAEADAKA